MFNFKGIRARGLHKKNNTTTSSSTSPKFRFGVYPEPACDCVDTRKHTTNKKRSLGKTKAASKDKKVRKQVSFDETKNIVHTDKDFLSLPLDGDRRSLWYSVEELTAFKQETKELFEKLQSDQEEFRRTDPYFWANGYSEMYLAFCANYRPETLQRLVDSTPYVFNMNSLGMERCSIDDVAMDSFFRQQRLYRAVQKEQKQQSVDAHRLQRICKSWSKPAALYAHYVALVAATANISYHPQKQ